jgi:hypothetical protein
MDWQSFTIGVIVGLLAGWGSVLILAEMVKKYNWLKETLIPDVHDGGPK